MASEIKGPEPIIQHVLDILEEHMTAKLAALDLVFGDFTLKPIQAFYLGGSDGKAVWPSLAASEEDPTTLAPMSQSQYISYPIVIGCLNLDDGSGYQHLIRTLYRYQRAIMEILRDHKAESGYWLSVVDAKPMSDGPWPTEEDESVYAAVKGVRAWFMSTEQF